MLRLASGFGLMAMMFTAGAFAEPASAQLGSVGTSRPFARGRIPADLERHIAAVGPRVSRRGQERVHLDGQFIDATGGQSTARVTIELPGKVRLDGMRADDTPILFDGDIARTSVAGLTAREQALLDTFALDSIEGMLGQASLGAAVRLLGRGFGPDPATVPPGGDVPYYDIFEVTGPAATRPGRGLQTRRYYFDSGSGLLVSVRHTENGQRIETRYSNWGEEDGSMYPGRVESFEGGTRLFAFTTEAVQGGPADDIMTFRIP